MVMRGRNREAARDRAARDRRWALDQIARLWWFLKALIPVLVGLLLASLAWSAPEIPAVLRLAGVAVGLGQGAALWWRRRQPVIVMAIALVGGLVIQLISPDGVFPFAGLVAITALAATRPPRLSLPALAALEGLTALNFITTSAEDSWFAMMVVVVPWALGEAARNRRVAIEIQANRAVTEERMRIAREMHDVLAHSVSAIVVQAGAAEDVFDVSPRQARAALRTIETTGREVLAELRQLLADVRPDEQGEPRRPPPSLKDAEELAAPLRAAGVVVELRREGQIRELPASVDAAAYRIVQEALTNTLRHARATRAVATLRYEPAALEVSVTDDGAAGADDGAAGGDVADAAPAGHGIAGMRERAAMLGGRLDASRQARGGFRVHATLPLGAQR